MRRRGALVDRQEFALPSQPQLRGSAVTGVKALPHRDLGEAPPEQFIPIAGDNAVILPLGTWVLDQAARWQAAGTPLRVAVNISPRPFAQPSFVDSMRDPLTRHHLRGEWLELEVTERLVIRDIKGAARTIRQLRRLGVLMALCTFGAGHSVLSSPMKLTVVAKGIETERQVQLVRFLRCEQVQAFLLARPRPAAELTHWLVTLWEGTAQ
ncbi:EAL domain-containing protein [Deinococcus sp. HMF7620]|uniref:EAL domain-containing protein n=1 Tax=Deinococcus arboris TaxID=2682977 RepID=A0A7C9M4K0_9DEIO|nr:EAL domain-containing protein [Deinococcus arboris]MVN89122.1 EAL domain-containing protein [Deinococcus arboris]